VNKINRRIGTSMHHDTITGTSPQSVIEEAAKEIMDIYDQNAHYISLNLKKTVFDDHHMKLEKIHMCNLT
jgi:hypothetical protein